MCVNDGATVMATEKSQTADRGSTFWRTAMVWPSFRGVTQSPRQEVREGSACAAPAASPRLSFRVDVPFVQAPACFCMTESVVRQHKVSPSARARHINLFDKEGDESDENAVCLSCL